MVKCFVCGFPLGEPVLVGEESKANGFRFGPVRRWTRDPLNENRLERKLLKYKNTGISVCPDCFANLSAKPVAKLNEIVDAFGGKKDYTKEHAFCIACEKELEYEFGGKAYYIVGKTPMHTDGYMLDVVCPRCTKLAFAYYTLDAYECALKEAGASRIIRAGNWEAALADEGKKKVSNKNRLAKILRNTL